MLSPVSPLSESLNLMVVLGPPDKVEILILPAFWIVKGLDECVCVCLCVCVCVCVCMSVTGTR